MESKGGIRNRAVKPGGPDRDAGDHRWPGRQRARRKKIDDLVDDETTVNPKLPSTGERGENGARYLADPRLQGRTVADPWGDMGGDRVRDRIGGRRGGGHNVTRGREACGERVGKDGEVEGGAGR